MTRGPNESHMGVHVRTPIRDSLLVMMDRAGAEWVRWTFHWPNVEDSQGNFDFSAYSDDIRTLYNNDKKILAVIGKSLPSHVELPFDGADYDEYKDLLTAIESTFGDTIDHYEVWNEAFNEAGDNLLFPGTRHDLIELVEHAHEAVGSSGNTILCCGFQDVADSLDIDFVASFADSVPDLDVITLHYYTIASNKEDLPAFVQEIRTDDSNAHPIWMTEFAITNEPDPDPPHWEDGELLDYVFEVTDTFTGWEKSFLYTLDGDDTVTNRRLLEGNASLYTNIYFESFCRMVQAAGNFGQEPLCTDDLGLSLTTLPLNTVCSLTISYNGTGFNFINIQANEPLYNASDGDQYFEVETEDKDFDIILTIDRYYQETIPITVSSVR